MPQEKHTQPSSDLLREIVFGMEDGMVSTLGAVTGIATATGNHFTTVLAGFVVIAVESISMGVGSYISNKTERQIDARMLAKAKEYIETHRDEKKEELKNLYIADGWSKTLATKMVADVAKNDELFVKELAFRQLEIIPEGAAHPYLQGIAMLISYIIGGSLPLLPYVFLNIATAIPISIAVTFVGLFVLGSYTTKFTGRSWWRAGLEMLGLAGAATVIGYSMGQLVEVWFGVRVH